MGKATIVSNQGLGLYRVEINYDRTRADALITQLTAERADVVAELPGLSADISTAEAGVDAATTQLNTAINAGDDAAIRIAQIDLLRAQITLSNAWAEYNQANLHQIALLRQINTLQAQVPTDHEVDAWCADFSLEIADGTEVGTIEVGRRESEHNPSTAPETGYLIRPNSHTASDYSAAKDGQIFPTMSQRSEQAFWNYAFLPGMDRWRPRYRTAYVTDVDTTANTVDIILDAVAVTHQQISINGGVTAVAGVTVEYMTKHAENFQIGDHVVVEFRPNPGDETWFGEMVVIGFTANPRSEITTYAWAYNGATFRADQLTPPITWYIWGKPNGFETSLGWVPWGSDPSVGYPQAWLNYSEFYNTWEFSKRIDPLGPPEWCQLSNVYSAAARLDTHPTDPLAAILTLPIYPEDPLGLRGNLDYWETAGYDMRMIGGNNVGHIKAEDTNNNRQNFSVFQITSHWISGTYRDAYWGTDTTWEEQYPNKEYEYPQVGFQQGDPIIKCMVWEPNTSILWVSGLYNVSGEPAYLRGYCDRDELGLHGYAEDPYQTSYPFFMYHWRPRDPASGLWPLEYDWTSAWSYSPP